MDSPLLLFTIGRFQDVTARLLESSFLKNILVVMSGTAAAQVIGFALSPIISRLYSPSDFGILGSFNAILTVISAAVTLDYPQALMLPKKKEDALNLFIISCLSTILISACCLTFCFFVPNIVKDLIKSPSNWIITLLVLATLVNGLNQSCQAWCVRVKRFSDTSLSQVIRSVSSNGMQVGFGYLNGGPNVLISSLIIGDILASFNLVRVVLRDIKNDLNNITLTHLKQLAIEYRDFPIYSASMYVLNSLSTGLPVLLLTHYFGIAVGGFYAFGVRIIHVPMSVVSGALRQVLFQKACDMQNKGGRLLPLYFKTTLGLFALASVPAAILFTWSPLLFSWLFGSQWLTAGEYARFLVVWLLFAFCNLPAILFAKIFRVQRFVFVYNTILLILRVLILVLGGLYLNALQTVTVFSFGGAIMNIMLIIIIGCVLMRREGNKI